jgi:hypothetical protein
MKRICLFAFGICIFGILFGCAHQADRATASAWLQMKKTGAASDVSGNWQGPQSGWGLYGLMPFGTIILVQQEGQLNGNWSDQEVIGAVSKDEIYLVSIYKGSAQYTFHLKLTPKQDALLGKYCKGFDPEVKDGCDSISLIKIEKVIFR